MDPIKSIGQLLKGHEQKDAVHMAIVPVIAGEYIAPGSKVALVIDTTDQVENAECAVRTVKPIGVLDPFLEQGANKGDRCWLFLYPGTVTGMRHEWRHPAFKDTTQEQADKSESVAWLRDFADKWNFDYDDMIENAQQHEGYIVAGGIDLHSRGELDAGDEENFWYHIEVLTGFKATPDHRESFGWSCSC